MIEYKGMMVASAGTMKVSRTTPPEELYVMYRRVHRLLEDRHISVHRAYVGEYATSMEMAGASFTFFRLDDELAGLLDHTARTPFFTQL